MFAKSLKNINKADVAVAGGKGASLGEMIQNEIPVPDGFVILTNAFTQVLLKNKLNEEIEKILCNIDYNLNTSVEQASIKIKSLIMKVHIPNTIIEEIMDCYKNLGSEYVAVRSSATNEDSTTNAWAGQLDSYLNTTENNLIENVKKCWASLYNARAICYRNKLEDKDNSVAVVVQKMIQAEVSGICFTANPLTNDTSQMLIEAGYGLGEAIVGGVITPDTYVVKDYKNEVIIESKRISDQQKMLIKYDNTTIEKTVDKEYQKMQKLNDTQILLLSDLCKKIYKHYNIPQDIEWALENDRFYIVQSRPITTIKEKIGITEYIKSQKWNFGIKANESLLFYSAKQQGAKEYFENIFIYLENDYPIRISNAIQIESFYKNIEKQILKTPEIISNYINKSNDIWQQILKLGNELEKLVASNNYEKSKKIFIDIMKLYEAASSICAITFSMGVKIAENKDKLKDIEKVMLKHDIWRNSIAEKEEKMGETIFYFLELVKKKFYLKHNPLEIMKYLTSNELIKFLENKLNQDKLNRIIEKRKMQGYIYICLNNYNKEVIDNITEIKQIKQYFVNMSKNSETKESEKMLCGQLTYRYNKKIRGKVLVIKDKNELNKKGISLKNKILVAIQTTPQYINYLTDAKAIITDEGGITCHAAIISRELKKPCIIGTSKATTILKNDDYVELDFNNGSIRIVKKAE